MGSSSYGRIGFLLFIREAEHVCQDFCFSLFKHFIFQLLQSDGIIRLAHHENLFHVLACQAVEGRLQFLLVQLGLQSVQFRF